MALLLTLQGGDLAWKRHEYSENKKQRIRVARSPEMTFTREDEAPHAGDEAR